MCRLSEQQAVPHTDKMFVPLYTGLLEKWEFQIISVMKLKLQDTRNPELNGHHAQSKDRRTVDKFFNALKKVATKRYLSNTPGNIFNADVSGIQINQIPDSVNAENWSKYVQVLTSGEEIERLTVIVCSNVTGQFLLYAIMFKVLNKKQEFLDELHPWSDLYVNRKSSAVSTSMYGRDAAKSVLFVALYLGDFHFCSHIAYSLVKYKP
jgi:hypothetical protein